MEVLYSRCAGADVHKDSVVACIRIADGAEVRLEVRRFGTTTTALYALADWLAEEGVTHVAMESTGVYWKPVWHVLEEGFQLVLANAKHIKNVPGRKTDVNDATWIAELLAHGLIRGSFVPERPIQELRDLTRARKQLVRERVRYTQRIHKVLEDANIKVASVLADVLGKSGRKMLEAIVAGQTDPVVLAALANKRVEATPAKLTEALRGHVTEHHRIMLRLYLDQVDATDRAIAALEGHLEVALRPFREAIDLVTTVPGLQNTAAAAVIAEIGADMQRFATAGRLISWAGLCPRADESAGKRRSTRIREGAPWLKTVLVQAAWGAVRNKSSYERALYFRLKSRRGAGKAIVAVAASILRAIYHMLRSRQQYRSLGAEHFDTINRDRLKRGLVRRLQNLGFQVDLRDAA